MFCRWIHRNWREYYTSKEMKKKARLTGRDVLIMSSVIFHWKYFTYTLIWRYVRFLRTKSAFVSRFMSNFFGCWSLLLLFFTLDFSFQLFYYFIRFGVILLSFFADDFIFVHLLYCAPIPVKYVQMRTFFAVFRIICSFLCVLSIYNFVLLTIPSI